MHLDHTIVPSRNKAAAAKLLAELLGVPWAVTQAESAILMFNIRKIPVFIFTVLLNAVAMSVSIAEDKTIEPKGEYAEIDTSLAREAAGLLTKGTAKEKQKTVKQVTASPEKYAPPVFYILSNVLFNEGWKDEAAFWFYAGQLRARFDANRCADESSRQVVSLLNQKFGSSINEYTFQNMPMLEKLIPKVVQWDRETPHSYDHRWINLYGMGAVISASGDGSSKAPLSFPKEQWDKIAEETRSTYIKDFEEVMAMNKRGERTKRNPFDIHGGSVRFTNLAGQSYTVPEADPASFEHAGGIYGRDKRHVFYAYDLVKGADPASFVSVGEGAGRDAKSVYFGAEACADCDAASFRSLDVDWYADKNTVYYSSKPVPEAKPDSFKRFNFWFAKDAFNVFWSGGRIPGADAASFKLASCGVCEVCGEDKNRCYWNEYPVPCDCKPHSMADFPDSLVEMLPGKALLVTSGPVNLDFTEVNEAVHGMSAGYLRVDAGKHTLPLKCWDKIQHKTLPLKLDVDFKAAKIYRLVPVKSGTCEGAQVEFSAMVKGRVESPEIRINLPEKGLQSQIELAPGAQTIRAVCRDVTRKEIIERSVEIGLELKPGDIYELQGDFKAPEYKCNVRPVLVN